MASSSTVSCSSLFVLFLCVSLHTLPPAADAARLPPGSSPIVEMCKSTPYPETCVGELGQRLLDIQIAVASATDKSATIAGAPGQVDPKSLVAVALGAAAEAGAVAATIFEGKLPGFNCTVPDFKRCVGNCSVAMKCAMKKIHGASSALKAGANVVAKTLASRAIADVSECKLSCKGLNGDVVMIMHQSVAEFKKMLQLAVNFVCKLKPKPGPPPPAPQESAPTPPAPESYGPPPPAPEMMPLP